MTPSVYVTCFLLTDNCLEGFKIFWDATRGVLFIQTEDTSYAWNENCSELEAKLRKTFHCKPPRKNKDENGVKFNGAVSAVILLRRHVWKIKYLSLNKATMAWFVTETARGAHVAVACFPDATCTFNEASKTISLEAEHDNFMNKTIKVLLSTPKIGLRFIPHDL